MRTGPIWWFLKGPDEKTKGTYLWDHVQAFLPEETGVLSPKTAACAACNALEICICLINLLLILSHGAIVSADFIPFLLCKQHKVLYFLINLVELDKAGDRPPKLRCYLLCLLCSLSLLPWPTVYREPVPEEWYADPCHNSLPIHTEGDFVIL